MLVCSFAIAFGLDLTPYLINPSTLPTRWTRISTIALHRHLHLQARPCGGPYTGNTYIYNISRYTYILVYLLILLGIYYKLYIFIFFNAILFRTHPGVIISPGAIS